MTGVLDQLIAERVARFVDVCRRRRLKLTPQRLEIFRELASTAEHPSAEGVFRRLQERMPTVSLDTVYRTLNSLQEHGLVGRVEVLDERSRYDANLDRHHHLVCTECGAVEDLYWPDLDGMQLPSEGHAWGSVHQLHAELRGRCRACLEREESTREDG